MQMADQLTQMNADELREFAARLITEIAQTRREISLKQLRIDQLTHEMAILKRWKFAARSEQLRGEQSHLFDETLQADLEAIGLELEALKRADEKTPPKEQPKRAPLPAHLPRTEVRHEPDSTICACGCALKRIGEDVSEKLEYTPGVFSVERHIRGKWACTKCQTLTQAPVPAHVIDKGIPTTGLLAQVLVAKYLDHQPLYRQEGIFARAGVAIARSTLAQWVGTCGVRLQPLADALREALLGRGVLHADETPVAMLSPGKGKTHRAYLWTYGTSQYDALKAVVYDFADSRAGEHARRFLEGWSGTLVCDDFSGYKALFERGVTEAGCLAHYLERSFIWTWTRAAACRRWWLSRRLLHIIPSRARVSADAARSTFADSVAHEFRRADVRRGPRVEDGDDIEVPVARSRRLRLCASRQLRTRQTSRRSRGSLVLPAGTPHLQLVA